MIAKYYLSFLFLIVLSVVIPDNANAQECKYLFPAEVGTTLEYTFYNKKGREDSYQTQKVVEINQVDGATVFTVEASTKTGKKEDDAVVTTFEIKCDGGNFYMNMGDFTSSVNYDQYQGSPDMEVVVNSDDLFYPSDLSVGQTLPEGSIEMSVEANGMMLFGSTITIKDRKVEAKESITTAAGTFECFKVSSVILTKSVMNMETKTIQWIADGVGIVKIENLSSKGKLIGYQLLTGIKD